MIVETAQFLLKALSILLVELSYTAGGSPIEKPSAFQQVSTHLPA